MSKGLPQILKENRKRQGFSTRTLSETSGVNENLIKGYENGNYNPSIWKLQKVCKSLKISMDDALNGKEYDYGQVKNPRDKCYTLVNKTKGFVVKQGERKTPYPFVKIIDPHDKKSVGTIIKETRICLGYTLPAMSEKIGCSVSTIYSIETKSNPIEREGFHELIKVLKLSLEDLLKGLEYDYIQRKNPSDQCYVLVNKTKDFIVESGVRKEPYPFVIIEK